jgi:hypothetical protein
MPGDAVIPDDLEQLRRRFEEFRATPIARCVAGCCLEAVQGHSHGLSRRIPVTGQPAISIK